MELIMNYMYHFQDNMNLTTLFSTDVSNEQHMNTYAPNYLTFPIQFNFILYSNVGGRYKIEYTHCKK